MRRPPRMATSVSSMEDAAASLDDLEGGSAMNMIHITKFNLLSSGIPKLLNKTLYAHKLADELLRYHRIRNFILGPDSSIPFQIIRLTLGNNEQIFPSDEEYQKAKKEKKYVKISNTTNTTFDTVKKK